MSWTSTPDGPAPHDAAGHPLRTVAPEGLGPPGARCLHLPIQPIHPLHQVRPELSSN